VVGIETVCKWCHAVYLHFRTTCSALCVPGFHPSFSSCLAKSRKGIEDISLSLVVARFATMSESLTQAPSTALERSTQADAPSHAARGDVPLLEFYDVAGAASFVKAHNFRTVSETSCQSKPAVCFNSRLYSNTHKCTGCFTISRLDAVRCPRRFGGPRCAELDWLLVSRG